MWAGTAVRISCQGAYRAKGLIARSLNYYKRRPSTADGQFVRELRLQGQRIHQHYESIYL